MLNNKARFYFLQFTKDGQVSTMSLSLESSFPTVKKEGVLSFFWGKEGVEKPDLSKINQYQFRQRAYAEDEKADLLINWELRLVDEQRFEATGCVEEVLSKEQAVPAVKAENRLNFIPALFFQLEVEEDQTFYFSYLNNKTALVSDHEPATLYAHPDKFFDPLEKEKAQSLKKELLNGKYTDRIHHTYVLHLKNRIVYGRLLASCHTVASHGGCTWSGLFTDLSGGAENVDLLKSLSYEYHLLIDNGKDFIWKVDQDHHIRFISQNVENLGVFKVKEMLGNPFANFIYPEDLPRCEQLLVDLYEKGVANGYRTQCADIEYRLGQAANTIWLSAKVNIYFNENKQPYFIGISRDITAEKDLLNKLKINESRYRLILDNTSDIIWQIDKAGFYTYVSASLKDLTGFEPEERLHIDSMALIHPDDRPYMQSVNQQILKEGRSIHRVQYRIMYKNGRYYWHSGSAKPILDAEGNIIGAVGTSRDIDSEHKALEEQKYFANLLQQFSQQTPGAFYLFEYQPEKCFRFPYVSNKFYTFFQCSPQSLHLNPQSIFDFIHPEDLEQLQSTIDEAYHHKKPWEAKFRIFSTNKEDYIWIRGIATSEDMGNGITRFFGFIEDITEKQLREERLKLMEEVVQNTNDAIVITKAEPIEKPGPEVVFVNRAFEQMTGYSPEEVLGKSPRILQGEGTDRSRLDDLKEDLKNWRNASYRLKNYTKSGKAFWIALDIVPLKNEEGWFTHWIAIQRDVTEEVVREAEKEQLIFELIKSNQELKQFSYITSHNLRAPIANLLGIVDLIESESLTHEEMKEMLNAFKVSCYKLDETVSDLNSALMLKDDEGGKNVEMVDVKKAWDKVVDKLSLLDTTPTNILKVDFQQSYILFNRLYLENIFQNLLSNSLKYKHTQRPLIIELKSAKTPDAYTLIYKDNGIGLNVKHYKDRIFGLYQKFHQEKAGKGLGLYLVKSQVEALGGSIHLDGKEGEGLTFCFSFPIK